MKLLTCALLMVLAMALLVSADQQSEEKGLRSTNRQRQANANKHLALLKKHTAAIAPARQALVTAQAVVRGAVSKVRAAKKVRNVAWRKLSQARTQASRAAGRKSSAGAHVRSYNARVKRANVIMQAKLERLHKAEKALADAKLAVKKNVQPRKAAHNDYRKAMSQRAAAKIQYKAARKDLNKARARRNHWVHVRNRRSVNKVQADDLVKTRSKDAKKATFKFRSALRNRNYAIKHQKNAASKYRGAIKRANYARSAFFKARGLNHRAFRKYNKDKKQYKRIEEKIKILKKSEKIVADAVGLDMIQRKATGKALSKARRALSSANTWKTAVLRDLKGWQGQVRRFKRRVSHTSKILNQARTALRVARKLSSKRKNAVIDAKTHVSALSKSLSTLQGRHNSRLQALRVANQEAKNDRSMMQNSDRKHKKLYYKAGRLSIGEKRIKKDVTMYNGIRANTISRAQAWKKAVAQRTQNLVAAVSLRARAKMAFRKAHATHMHAKASLRVAVRESKKSAKRLRVEKLVTAYHRSRAALWSCRITDRRRFRSVKRKKCHTVKSHGRTRRSCKWFVTRVPIRHRRCTRRRRQALLRSGNALRNRIVALGLNTK